MPYTLANGQSVLIAVKGAGDLATGVIHRLVQAGFAVMATELPQPTVIRRTVAFAEAVIQEEATVEGVTARLAPSLEDIQTTLARGMVPVVIDPDGTMLKRLEPAVLVEATLSKHNTGISRDDAPVVIALGPGYEAGKDVHAVIETNRGHNLGRVYFQGSAEPNTGKPGAIGGYTTERILRTPCAGTFHELRQIGDMLIAGEAVAFVRAVSIPEGETMPVSFSMPVVASISGILRGLLRDGLTVTEGMKVGDIDPRATREHCFTISDKSRAIAGGVLEAILYLLNQG